MGRSRRPQLSARQIPSASPPPPVRSPTKPIVPSSDLTFKMYGVSPIWGAVHRDLLKHAKNSLTPPLVWIPESNVEWLCLKIAKPDTPRVVSPWGNLICADATSDPSVLCPGVLEARRVPFNLCGSLIQPAVATPLQKLMREAPSEFPSLCWGHRAEFAAVGAKVLPGAHLAQVVDHMTDKIAMLYNAGQTTKPDLTPERCVAYVPLLVPEMKFEYTALSYYWDVVLNRGRFNFSNEWFTEELVKSRALLLKPNARCVSGRYNMYDLRDFKVGFRIVEELRREMEWIKGKSGE